VNSTRGAAPALRWPSGAAASVSLTFDVDAESALMGLDLTEASNYSAFSERRFGVARGLPRILSFLSDEGIKGTFYVPGYTADRYPDAVGEIVEQGHELAHHGYFHRPPNRLDQAGLLEELERGVATLEKLTGKAPIGYRSPSWEVTAETFTLLGEMGFEYDSSLMGDDHPYIETLGGVSLIELPVHWSLDDFPYYSWREASGGLMSDPATVSAIWMSEFRAALQEGGHVTYTAHPEITGRRSRFGAFQELVRSIRSSGDVWFSTHGEVSRLMQGGADGQSSATPAR
jgi:peptidoglycan/xylan/chitin deacetylase (PgdA/CDA1 family)